MQHRHVCSVTYRGGRGHIEILGTVRIGVDGAHFDSRRGSPLDVRIP